MAEAAGCSKRLIITISAKLRVKARAKVVLIQLIVLYLETFRDFFDL
jgi:hypothetical protein